MQKQYARMTHQIHKNVKAFISYTVKNNRFRIKAFHSISTTNNTNKYKVSALSRIPFYPLPKKSIQH